MSNPGTLLECLGNAIVARRYSLSYSQQDLAQRAGVNRSYLSDVERGLRNITLSTLENIAQALNMTPSELLLSADQMRREQLASG